MADFLAGYISGAIGIIVGSPLDILKVHRQASSPIQTSAPIAAINSPPTPSTYFPTPSSLIRGATAPILGYGGLTALLFVTYNRTLTLLASTSLPAVWAAGAFGGLASFVISSPTELVKCRAQLSGESSLVVAKRVWSRGGVRGLYYGGGVTALRDSVGYGF
jgi:solute carrier family 25 carnitine/acylcarnitine transporter 20/29